MTDQSLCNETGIEIATRLLDQIQSGDADAATKTLEELSTLRETKLFNELGKLTRDLHDTLNGFQVDSRITSMAEKDIPDAKERLSHVITMTEKAAETTLGAVEKAIPVADELALRTVSLHEGWTRFRQREMDIDEFRKMSSELDVFFGWLNTYVPEINASLSEIMLAQGFQDLTGQIIRRVIKLVQDVEDSLVGLVRMTGEQIHEDESPEKKGTDITAVGPVVPGVDITGVVNGQDEVDDLLSSLGF